LLHALGMFATGKPNRPIKFFFHLIPHVKLNDRTLMSLKGEQRGNS
jgi:hypothetical protein